MNARPSQFEIEHVGCGFSKLSVYDGRYGELLYSITINENDAQNIAQELKDKGYVERGLPEEGLDDWGPWESYYGLDDEYL